MLPPLPNDPAKTNWVEHEGGLPDYIMRVAKHIFADGKYTVSEAIAGAVSQTKKRAAEGNKEAIAAVAEWEKMKASTHVDNNNGSTKKLSNSIRITPLGHFGNTIELSAGTNIFEKQVLPYGKFNYQGDSFEITSEWVDNAIRAFDDKAFDQTVVALADENNSHNVDSRPDRFGGEVIKFKKTPEGLNAIVRLTNKTADLVRETDQKLGVSVRFRECYTREADGKTWPVVIDQVLGTLDPRITGMAPWKEITLSNTTKEDAVKDSSDGEWEMTKPTENDDKPNTELNKVTLTQDEYDALRALIKSPNANSSGTKAPNVDKNSTTETTKVDNPAPTAVTAVGLSNETSRIVELSHQVAYGRYERDALAWKQAGVPPRIIELAAPVLASYEAVKTVSLSNGIATTVDAREVIRSILDECKGTIDLSQEAGHTMRGSDQDKEFDKLYKSVLAQVTQF